MNTIPWALVIMWVVIHSASLATTTNTVEWQQQAIEHNAAQYHPTTGEFEWLIKQECEK